MLRLSRYIFGQLLDATIRVLALVVTIGWLVQLLGSFSLVTDKGQSLLVLLTNTGLLMPSVISAVLPACVVLGFGRAFREMDNSRELQSIHGTGRISPILIGFGAATLLAALLMAGMEHFIKPAAQQAAARQLTEVNADVIARTSTAGAFTQVESGVTLRIDGRAPDGGISGFFLEDARGDEVVQTIHAQSASVERVDEGIQVVLGQGTLQVLDRETGYLSSVRFARYQLATADLIAVDSVFDAARFLSTPELVAGLGEHADKPRWTGELHMRLALPLFLVGVAALTLVTMGFPHSRPQRQRFPIEMRLLLVAVAIHAAGAVAVVASWRNGAFQPLVYLIVSAPLAAAAGLGWIRFGGSATGLTLRRRLAR